MYPSRDDQARLYIFNCYRHRLHSSNGFLLIFYTLLSLNIWIENSCSLVTPLIFRRFTLSECKDASDIFEQYDALQSYDRARYVKSCRISPHWTTSAESLPRYIDALRSMLNPEVLLYIDYYYTIDMHEVGGLALLPLLANLENDPQLRLVSFTSNARDPPYGFLLSQPSILHLSLPQYQFSSSRGPMFTPDHVPSLLSLLSPIFMIECLTPNRPIRDATASTFGLDMTILPRLCASFPHISFGIQRLAFTMAADLDIKEIDENGSLPTVRSLELTGVSPLDPAL